MSLGHWAGQAGARPGGHGPRFIKGHLSSLSTINKPYNKNINN